MPADLHIYSAVGMGPFFYLGLRETEQAADLAIWDRVTLNQLPGVALCDVEPLAQFGES
jgi:hypothetical protein